MPVKRSDLCVGYRHQLPPKSPYASSSGVSGVVNQSTPMVAMFLKNKFLAWFALIQSFYAYLNFVADETSSNSSNPTDQSPGIRVLMSLVGLFVCYMGLVFPQPAPASLGQASNASSSASASETTAAATSS
ncbi:hypothetical protein ZYGR_0AI06850 [Zygosaccharomyces rouxii]|uniref:Uncharacterized protein n=1 Tax=Zygosaccharomyces rouxii TaxID=4956 RepID=A0A1Q3ACN6_ZYGRO|nr:hypothetical protein ZYGR_0AI06850 [Zygosaccharomyces rouxii]